MLNLLWLVVAVLVGLWVLGFATATTMGGAIHVLLVVAIVVIVARILLGRRAV